MFSLCLEAQKFISVCEDIQFLLAQGRTLTSDEEGVIEFAATELLLKVIEAKELRMRTLCT